MMSHETALQIPELAERTTIQDFAATDFAQLPEGRSEAVYIGGIFRVVVNADIAKSGHFCVSVHRLATGEPVTWGTYPLDDLNDKLRDGINALQTMANRENRAFLN